MNETIFEVIIVFILIVLNGFFSGAEMALISLRKTRIQQLVKEGNKRAILVQKILRNPEEFLATIQVGITFISTIASAYAGANIAGALSPILKSSSLPIIAQHAEILSFSLIVVVITYLTLVLGELIPKSLGIKFSERFSLLVVSPLNFLSRVSFPLTKFLTFSSNLILKIFGDKTNFSEANLTEEELRTLLYESHKAGTLKEDEHEILDNIFDFSDIAVNQIMTPSSKIFAIDIGEPFEKNVKSVIDSGYSRIPVFKDNIDHLLGILHIKDLLKALQIQPQLTSLDKLIKKPFFTPNTQRIIELLKGFQKGKTQLAIVTDEYGDVDGLVTIEDILEEIVGDIADETDEEKKVISRQKDGSYLIEGSMSLVDFNRHLKTSLPENEQYTSVSGLLLHEHKKIPDVGTQTIIGNIEFTIQKKTERTIQLIAAKKLFQKE